MRPTFVWLNVILGLPVLAALGGCGGDQSTALPPAPLHWDEMAREQAVHAHPTEGPHHGLLLEIGERDYHAELVHDDARDSVDLYLLDENASKAVPVTESRLPFNLIVDGKPTQFHLLAAPLAGESEGQSSHFELRDPDLSAALLQLDNRSRFNVSINGKFYVVPIPRLAPSKDHIAGKPSPRS